MGIPGLTDQSVASQSDVGDIKDYTDTLPDGVTQATGTFEYDETNAAEQDAFEVSLSARTVIGSIWLDLVNVTQNSTVRVYHKIDGTNYRLFASTAWVLADPDGFWIEGFTARDDVKVSLQCGGGGAGTVDVPYAVV
jgi:hypothetical protein